MRNVRVSIIRYHLSPSLIPPPPPQRLVSELLLSSPSLATTAVDEDGTSPLHLAANSHSTAILELLVKHGAWVNSQNDDGLTPLHVAALWGKAEAVQLLLARGADPAITDCDELSPLDHAQNEGTHGTCTRRN